MVTFYLLYVGVSMSVDDRTTVDRSTTRRWLPWRSNWLRNWIRRTGWRFRYQPPSTLIVGQFVVLRIGGSKWSVRQLDGVGGRCLQTANATSVLRYFDYILACYEMSFTHPVITTLDLEVLILSLNIIVLMVTMVFSCYYLLCFNNLLHVDKDQPLTPKISDPILDIETTQV